jgi:hypothetical protein
MRRRTKYYIQVKSESARVSRGEIRKLRALAKRRRGVAVVVHTDSSGDRWRFYGNWSKRKRR